MTMAAQRRYWTLDVLRGVCALIIFFSHWILFSNFTPAGAIENGIHRALHAAADAFAQLFWPLGANHPAVICFFVLSGFCIHIAYARDAQAGRRDVSWRGFYRRRFFRIMPVYWTATLLGCVFVAYEIRHPSGSPLLHLHAESSPIQLLVRFAGATDLYPHEIIAGNLPLNTVGIELLCYAAYPLFYAQAARGRWLGLGVFFLLLEGVGELLLRFASPFWVYNTVLMFGLFWFAGAFLADLVTRHGPRRCIGPLIVTWALFIVLNQLPHFYGLSVIKQNVCGLGCYFGVQQALYLESRRVELGSTPVLRLMRFAGEISYSTYAVHTPILLLTTAALLQAGITRYSIQLAATLTAAVAGTLVVYFQIERVFYRPRARGVAETLTRTANLPVSA